MKMFSTKNRIRAINLFLIFISCFTPIFIFDLILKNIRFPKDSNRLMLLAGSSLYSSSNGYRRYESNKNIEQIAIYDDSIAYRYLYKSNNLGLISFPDLDINTKLDLAINGDSFTEGQGGYPWIIEWQKNELKNLNVLSLNYAIAGNGFGDFLIASKHAHKKFNAKKNIVFFIEHDAYRPYQKISKNKNCSFYSNGLLDKIIGPISCKTYGIVWHHISLNKSNEEILNQTKYLQQYGVLPTFNRLIKVLKNNNFKKDIESLKKDNDINGSNAELRFGPIPFKTEIAIKEINKLYGKNNVLFVQLPNTYGRPDKNAKLFTKIFSEIDTNKVVNLWDSCPLEKSDFHKLDSHPNNAGYDRLKECIAKNIYINSFVKN